VYRFPGKVIGQQLEDGSWNGIVEAYFIIYVVGKQAFVVPVKTTQLFQGKVTAKAQVW
jgi:hypothetical protein